MIAAAAAAAGVLFAAPAMTSAMPLSPIGSPAVNTVTQDSTAITQAAVHRWYPRHRWAGRHGGWGWRHNRWAGGCWNCGGWGWRHHRHWGSPYYLGFGYPYYGYPYGYRYPYGGYWGPSIGFGFRIH